MGEAKKPSLDLSMTNLPDWTTRPDRPFVFPERIILSPEQREFIEKALRSVSIDQSTINELFSGPRLPRILSEDRFVAVAVYAAIKEATKGEWFLTRSFKQWSREMGLPW